MEATIEGLGRMAELMYEHFKSLEPCVELRHIAGPVV